MVVEEETFSAVTLAQELPHNKIHLYKRMSPDDISSGLQFFPLRVRIGKIDFLPTALTLLELASFCTV
ncbi:MAG: hypothetical protein ACI90V_004284 [Bacillariaceae sp.]|jgi:hypothetical protein